MLVAGVLLVEHAGRRHRDNAHLAALLFQLGSSLHGQTDFRTSGDQDQFRLTRAVFQHITTTSDISQLLSVAALVRQVLPKKISADGPSLRSMAYFHATADSTASHGRQVSRFGVPRRLASCSIGWGVGPASPRAMEAWGNTNS